MRHTLTFLLFHLYLPLLFIHSPAFGSTDFAMLPALTEKDPTHKVLLDITRIESRIVVVGEQGLIIFSDNDGETWQQANVPVSVTLTGVFFSSPQNGWVVGHQGVILHSKDGGKSWQRQFSGKEAYQQAIDMVRSQITGLEKDMALATDAMDKDELSMQLDDAGFQAEELQKALDNGPSEPLLDVWFANDQRGVAIGAYGMLLMTNNGGQQWQLHPQYLSNIDKFHFYGIEHLSDGTLFLAGESGTIWRSLDEGASWQTISVPYQGSLFGIISTDNTGTGHTSTDHASTDHASLITYGLRGNIFFSSDKGDNWQKISHASEATLIGSTLAQDGKLYLVGTSGVIVSSHDGGQHLQELAALANRSTLSAALAWNNNTLFLVGQNGLHRYFLPSHDGAH